MICRGVMVTTFAKIKAILKYGSKASIDQASTFDERMAFLYILNDLLHWSGEPPPADLTASVQSIALLHLRAARYAPDVEDRGVQVDDLLEFWKERKFFEVISFSGLKAGEGRSWTSLHS